ncbi:MAG TPA: YdjY domain-containing protein [Gemmataceae bacterium]|jgi:hypothetical protein
MSTSFRTGPWLLLALLTVPACDPPAGTPPADKTAQPPAAQPQPAVKRAEVGKNVVLETQGDTRRVRVAATVCFREGALELLMCRRNTKEHESVLSADIDARQLHAALLLTGAKAGSPVKYEPKYTPATGTTIRVMLEYQKDGKTVTVRGQDWVRDAKTRKAMPYPWVFAGSAFYPDPEDPKKPPLYAANGGDVICVSNFPDAMLDLPVNSPQEDAERVYEAFTEHIPELGTPVTVILEPEPAKK